VIKNYKQLPHNIHYIAKISKVQKNKLIQVKQDTHACYVKIIWPTLTTHLRYVIQNTSFHIPLSIFIFIFVLFCFFLFNLKETNKNNLILNAWMLCNVILKTKENKNLKKNGQKGFCIQGSCQKDSIRLSLLHPKLLRCNSSVGIIIHIRIMSNSSIGIKI